MYPTLLSPCVIICCKGYSFQHIVNYNACGFLLYFHQNCGAVELVHSIYYHVI